ncbi:hypothetical protein FQN50_001170 [Emmonsiellopsis sp. PD_5]|nr:hypothetical protein FQN50_001170 [Emmonsiellopsis sp. PD_5]
MASSMNSSSPRPANPSDESHSSPPSPGSIIDATVKYRLGFPSPLPPVKTRHHPLKESKDTIPVKMIMDAVTSFLHQRKVDFDSVAIVSRQASADVLEPRPTVRIVAPAPRVVEADDDSWICY